MKIHVNVEQLTQLAPRMRPLYRDTFASGQPVLDLYGISDSARRVAHFIGQVLHESQALTVESENLHYSRERLVAVWPSRFLPLGPLEPALYARNPRKLANLVYGGRMGNVGRDDGFLYRGRGMLQLTGRDGYARVTRIVRRRAPRAPDFVADPDAVLNPAWCLHAAAATWDDKDCNALADLDDVAQLTRRINGGAHGLAQRAEWFRCAGEIWC
ncbi:MAG TPA: lytic enzyme [Telluria sp.]